METEGYNSFIQMGCGIQFPEGLILVLFLLLLYFPPGLNYMHFLLKSDLCVAGLGNGVNKSTNIIFTGIYFHL